METILKDIKAEVGKINERFVTYFSKAKVDEIANLYTEYAKLLPPGSDVIVGKENISNFWQGAIYTGVKCIKLETEDVEQHGDLAVEQGKYTLIGPDQNLIDKGKYLVVWKNENGDWKLHKDMWNSSFPEM